MGLFKRKKNSYVDLGEKLRKEEKKLENFTNNNSVEEIKEPLVDPEPTQNGFMGFFGGTTPKIEKEVESPVEERRKKLKSILNTLTDRLDEQEKEIYRLKQKLEVIERKQNVGYR